MPRATRLAATWLIVTLLAGCASPGYYWQAASGQLALMRAARPVAEVDADPATPPPLRARLALARELREFASRELGLPDNQSYRRYADLQRPYAVWNVFAAPEFSITPRHWCFPITGCVSYRGYFAEVGAREFAAGLRETGDDVYVAGIAAYSTLGWTADPLLNTFIDYPDDDLARLIFHELAHQVAYAGGDTEFNESFAMTVETEGLRRWRAARGEPAPDAAAAQRRRDEVTALLLRHRAALGALYASGQDAAALRAAKARQIDALREEYRALRDGAWGGYAGYDRWFAGDINNAVLASIGLYHARVPALQALLAQEGGELPRFYARVRALARLPQAERAAQLDRLAAQP